MPRSGSIPACAGKPSRAATGTSGAWVHPRVCGEARWQGATCSTRAGPSPRVRGSPGLADGQQQRVGSIPACAGKPTWPATATTFRRVHPRVCGEAVTASRQRRLAYGPSPRVRGSREVERAKQVAHGSIPACAGKPSCTPRASGGRAVHPRVCGEAFMTRIDVTLPLGPSPRVRGSLRANPRPEGCDGSIPACAGKPLGLFRGRGIDRVHPRVCGEAEFEEPIWQRARGPSPRVRGSQTLTRGKRADHRSIPACAGKPSLGSASVRGCAVHPRVCGEAHTVGANLPILKGPSPRVRGSRAVPRAWRVGHGSIPACAGKPTGDTTATA